MSMNYSEKEKTDNSKEVIVVLVEVLGETKSTVKYFISRNLGSIGEVLNIFIPTVCMACLKAFEGFIPWVVLSLILYYISHVLKRVNMIYHNRTIDNVPIPAHRFTNRDSDGEVYIESERVEELILYMEELENELEKMGKM